jgi:16S rRNA (cytosine1402-N4)-methyltransferase
MHKSVLLESAIEYLNLSEDSIVVDCTLGYAGHSSEILKRIKRGYLFAFDQDKQAINSSKIKLEKIGSNFTIISSNFVNLEEKLHQENVTKVDAILYDLGVSSPQLDDKERGFSFHKDARLDMRMNQDQSLSAYEVVNDYSYDELVNILYKYGEEKFAKSIVNGIIKNRPITTTLELVEVIQNNVPEKYRREHHPARKTFQAIRIEVNKELDVLESSLNQALGLLNVGGRICVITFHSLEDKIVKEIFRKNSQIDKNLNQLPVIPEELLPKFKVIKTILPTESEIEDNSRARSAKMRVIERVR